MAITLPTDKKLLFLSEQFGPDNGQSIEFMLRKNSVRRNSNPDPLKMFLLGSGGRLLKFWDGVAWQTITSA